MSPASESAVLGALQPIIDPDFQKSIVDLGFVKNIRIEGTRVSFAIELTTPACPVKEEFQRAARERVLALDGVEDVEVTMTSNTRGRGQAAGQGAAPKPEVLPGVKNVIAVASGKGGVGKSTVALNLALALNDAGARVGVMDADVYGPSLPLLSGVHGRPHVSEENERIYPHDALGIKLMSMGFFLTDDSPVIWRGPMVHGLVGQFLRDVEWGELDYLVVDMPPGTGDAALTLTQEAPLAGAVIITTANDLSLIDARKGLRMFETVQVPVDCACSRRYRCRCWASWRTCRTSRRPICPIASTTCSARVAGSARRRSSEWISSAKSPSTCGLSRVETTVARSCGTHPAHRRPRSSATSRARWRASSRCCRKRRRRSPTPTSAGSPIRTELAARYSSRFTRRRSE